jgi:putative ABC transport system permease protein
MIRLLRQVSAREFALRRGRTALLLGSVATGVAVIVAVGVINASVLASFRRTFESVAGPADLEVTFGSGEVAFDQELVARIRNDPDVLAAVPLVHGTVALADDAANALQLFGAELTAEEDFARYGIRLASARRAALTIVEDPHGILVSETVATRLGVGAGSPLRLATARGIGEFTIRGLLAPEGLAAALAGQLVVMDLTAAQAELDKTDRVDQVDIALRPGTDANTARRRIASVLPDGFSVAPPAARGARYGDILRGLQTTFASMSLMCMVAGLFVIQNGISASVVHRTSVIATLRVLGADRTTVFRLLLMEAFLLGAAGSALGVAIGVGLGRLLLSLVGTTLGTMEQMRFIVPQIAIDPRSLLFAAAVGTTAAVVGAWVPARRTRGPILLGIRPDVAEPPARIIELGVLAVVVSAIAVAVVLAGARAHDGGAMTTGMTIWYVAATAVGVPIVAIASHLLERWLPRAYGVAGRVAAASVTRVPVRAGMTVAAIAYVFAIAVTLAAVNESYVRAARDFVSDLQDGDLVVSAVATEGGWLEAPVSDGVVRLVGGVAGVARVEGARVVPGQHFRTGRIGIVALEPEALARLRARQWREGDLDRARKALAAGEGVAVSTVFANTYGTRVGDRIAIDAPTGRFERPVVGMVGDMTSSSGSILMSRALYADRWHDPTVSRINVYLTPGVGTEEARAHIVAAVGSRYQLKIDAIGDALAYIDGKIREAFSFSRSLQLLIVIVAIAGIFDLLFARIFERRRELATWRVTGASERAVRRSVIAESLALGVLASVLGTPLGVVTAWLWVRNVIPSLVGYDIALLVPPVGCMATVAIVLGATLIAGRAAAGRATRASILEGLRDD